MSKSRSKTASVLKDTRKSPPANAIDASRRGHKSQDVGGLKREEELGQRRSRCGAIILTFYYPGSPDRYMSRRGNKNTKLARLSDFGKACSSRREELRSLRRTEGDRTSVKKYDFEVLPVVFTILAVAFVFAWALDL